ncbi:MAG TPA: hypothetical protein VL524_09870 [Gemmatimonadaceae bacterium]|nr:hypothetical protein [Gemmatimonadaceae bacterium]
MPLPSSLFPLPSSLFPLPSGAIVTFQFRIVCRHMTFRLTDAIFWFSAICCAVAQVAILRSVILAPQAEGLSSSSIRRRVTDIVWAILPGIALAAVFLLTWRIMHGSAVVVAAPITMQ